jgi:hypothetical protein
MENEKQQKEIVLRLSPAQYQQLQYLLDLTTGNYQIVKSIGMEIENQVAPQLAQSNADNIAG